MAASLYSADNIYLPKDKKANKKDSSLLAVKKKVRRKVATFPPIKLKSPRARRSPSPPERSKELDAVGRCVPPPPPTQRTMKNMVNQIALSNLLAAKSLGGRGGVVPASPHLVAPPPDTQLDVLTLIKAQTQHTTTGTLDLSYSGLTNTSMIICADILSTHPTITTLNLTGNLITEEASHLLLSMVRSNPNLLEITLTHLDLHPSTITLISDTCEANQLQRAHLEERRERRKLKRQVRQWRRRRENDLRDFLDSEKHARSTKRTERAEWLTAAKLAFKKDAQTILGKEIKVLIRKKKCAERAEAAEEEAVHRRAVHDLHSEWWVGVHQVEEASIRSTVLTEQTAARVKIKKKENENWIIQRRAEKLRLKTEHEQRSEVVQEEEAARAVLMVGYEQAAVTVEEEGQTQKDHYEGLLQDRIEREQAAEWKRKQEEMRVEAEKQWKKDRELREAAKREMDRRRERERECRSEHLRRALIEREDEKRRDMLCTLYALDGDVMRAQDAYHKAEQARTALYSTMPQPKLQGVVDTTVVHFMTEYSEFLPLQKDPGVVLEGLGEARWKEVEKQVTTARKAYKNEVEAVHKTLGLRGVELAPVLIPSLGVPVAGNVPTTAKEREKEREREKELQATVDEVISKDAVVWHDPRDVMYNTPPSFEAAKAAKLTMHGGTVEVSMQPSDILETHHEISIGKHITRGKLTASLKLDNDMALGDVDKLLSQVTYRCAGYPTGCGFLTQHVTIKLTLLFTTLGGEACDGHGRITEANPFTEQVEVTTKLVIPVLMSPPLITTGSLDHRTVTYMEGTPFDKAALFTDVTVADPPVVVSGNGLDVPYVRGSSQGAYINGVLVIKFVENHTADDEVVLRKYFEDDITIQDDKLTLGERGDGPFVANILHGNLITHKERDEKPGVTGPFSSEFRVVFTSVQCRGSFVAKLLKRLRFINQSQNPSTSRRVIRVTLIPDGFSHGSPTHVFVDIISEDDPTSLTLQREKIYYRPMGPTSVPEQLRCHLKKPELSLFSGALVADPDTFHVRTGSITVTCTSGAARTDSIYLRRSDGVDIDPEGNIISFEGVPMAVLTTDGQPDIFRIDFHKENDPASLAFVQQALRNICLANSLYSPAEGWRGYELKVVLGPSVGTATDDEKEGEDDDDDQILIEKIEVRISPDLFDVGNHWNIDYKEGAGAMRLAPFEVAPDQQAFVDTYNEGYILVELVEGGNEDDILNMRAPAGGKDPDLKMTLRPSNILEQDDMDLLGLEDSGENNEKQQEQQQGDSAEVVTQSLPQPVQEEEEGGGGLLSLRDRVRKKIQKAVVEQRVKRDSLIEKTRRGLLAMRQGVDERAGRGEVTVTDVTAAGGKRIGTLIVTPMKLLFRFSNKNIARKDVLSVLRLMTYSNRSNDPEVLQKIIRITLKDSGLLPSQLVLQVEIQNIDDVTEIRLANTRPKYRPGMKRILDTGCFAVAGFYRAILVDPDTEYFDGGVLTVELLGGGVKGDTLGFMTPEQQASQRIESEKYHTEMVKTRSKSESQSDCAIWEAPIHPDNLITKGKAINSQDGTHIATIDYPRCTVAGCNNIRYTFTKNTPSKIGITLVTYVLNCTTYAAAGDKVHQGQRTYQIKIKDAENPVEGKVKCFVDVSKPIVQHVTAKKGDKKGTVGEAVAVLDKVVSVIADGKPTAMLQHGYTQVSIINGVEESDQLFVASSGTNIQLKEGNASFGMDFIGKVTASPSKTRIEHSWASKLTAKALTALLASFHLKSATPGHRTIEFLVYDGHSDPSCIRTTLDIS